ncbi:RmlC-like cupin domain-containing protein [Coniochaeta sp. 2T2.1]|nr:RmlC-like cupin domain-containing protein [Coniochaeta sp. 2T2.1]
MGFKVFQLSGSCNDFPWGKKGSQSLAAQLCSKTPGTGFEIKEDQPYSEMWFGDYPDYPARIATTGELLKDALNGDKETLLGEKVIKEMDAQLPFLPKILSIAKALPLQIHPNKDLATKLHQKDPENFTDPNHKPEIAVALSKFETFAGFKPLDQIEPLFKLEPLRQFVPHGTDKWTDDTLREVTRAILKADESTLQTAQEALSKIPASSLGDADAAYILDLLPRLREQYGPSDPGTLVAHTMNFMVFGPGDAIYIPADGIHAYLSGNIVECMARSNNVLNSGFCPPADRNSADMFCDTLTFKAHSRDDVYLPAKPSEKSKNGNTVVYAPPTSEFNMLKTELKPGAREEISPSEGPATLIVTQGKGKMYAELQTFDLSEGFIFFVAPSVPVEFETETGMQIHMAYV